MYPRSCVRAWEVLSRQPRSARAEGTDATVSLKDNGANASRIRAGAAGSRSIAVRSVTDA